MNRIVDIHTHLGWYPDHIGEEFAREALQSKLVKLAQSGGEAHAQSLDLHAYDSHQEDHWTASETADKVVVFGLQAEAVGYFVPNDLIANYVAEHPDKLVGWASINPLSENALDELQRCVEDLKLHGLKLGPAYQHFDPASPAIRPFLSKVQEYQIPTIWHQGTTFPSKARLGWASPLQLEDIAMCFPDLTMIVAHLGHPWEEDLVALIRKAPNMYADISAVHYRPWRYWQAMVTAMEYGVSHKLLLGSDFPSGTVSNVINGLENINRVVEGTSLPKIPEEIRQMIVYENWKQLFPEWV